VEALIAAEKAVPADQLRVEVRLADLRQQTVQARNTEAIQKCTLIALMGVMTRPDGLRVGGELTVPSPTDSVSEEAALAEAMQQRPDYLAARAALAAEGKALAAARGAHWPTVALEGDYGGRWAADPSEHPAGAGDLEDVGWVGVVIDIPLFEGGRINANVREQRARLAASQERLRKLELQVRLDVETAVLNLVSAHERVLATQKAIEQAEESLRSEQKKYDVGRGAIVDVLDAQAALLESQTTYYGVLADYSTAGAQLRLATGEEP
jgi:outer membrane protein